MATTPEVEPCRPVDETQMQQVLEFCEEFRKVVATKMPEFADHRDAFGLAMVAGVMFGGMQAGHMIAMGDYLDTPEQHKLFAQMLMTNFPQGVALGKHHAMQQLAALEGVLN